MIEEVLDRRSILDVADQVPDEPDPLTKSSGGLVRVILTVLELGLYVGE